MNYIFDKFLEVGCIWGRKCNVSMIEGCNTPHYIGYSANKAGSSVIEVVVIEGSYKRLALRTLINLAEQYQPKYVAIASEDEWNWFTGDDFRFCKEPVIGTEQPAFANEASFNMVFLTMFEQLGKLGYSPQEIKSIIDLGLLTHAYVFENDKSFRWGDITVQQFYHASQLALITNNFFETDGYRLLDDTLAKLIIYHLNPFPPTSPTLALSYVKLTSERVRIDLKIDLFPGCFLEDVLEDLQSASFMNGHMLDLSSGYGAFLIRAAQEETAISMAGVESNFQVFQLLKVVQAICGKQVFSIHYKLNAAQLRFEHYSMIVSQYSKQADRDLHLGMDILKKNGHLLLFCPDKEYNDLTALLLKDNVYFRHVKDWKENEQQFNSWRALLIQKIA